MKIIRRPKNNDPMFKNGSVITIGIFDGVHLGHQSLIKKLKQKSVQMGLPSIVFSFEPTPNDYFSKKQNKRLTSLRDKLRLIDEFQIDYLYCPPFDSTMENLSPNQFITKHLINLFNPRYMVIGDDFRFAKDRKGSIKDLVITGQSNNFEVEQITSIVDSNTRISSSLIRDSLSNTNLMLAKQMLGRNYSLIGRVIYGQQLGSTLGFPTANIDLSKTNNPLRGVFCVKVSLPDATKTIFGIANIGFKPTIGGQKLNLEVHLLDFDKDIYKSYIKIEFLSYLRKEKKFSGLDALKRQIDQDIEAAKQYFSTLDRP
ncbi:MAG: bifunctional riboflavin kinase/FAD synthetase [Gammaproteobacteria bacterium]|nr:bifunctional riboflavin kinase/FAD synthetase [Gammaproteobacteria bacterium]